MFSSLRVAGSKKMLMSLTKLVGLLLRGDMTERQLHSLAVGAAATVTVKVITCRRLPDHQSSIAFRVIVGGAGAAVVGSASESPDVPVITTTSLVYRDRFQRQLSALIQPGSVSLRPIQHQ